MESLAFLLVCPILWPFVAKLIWKRELTIREMGMNLAVGMTIVIVGWFGGRYAMTADVEILNGEVTRKYSEHVACEHSYQCNCTESCSKDKQGNESCSKSCSTCYSHAFDVDYVLATNLSQNIQISRVDPQGLATPPRFNRAQVGDPVALTHHYDNYVKGAPDSLFNLAAEKSAYAAFKSEIPPYPDRTYDYHYINRVLTVGGVSVPNAAEWNRKIAELLKTAGPAKQANVIVVFSGNADPRYASALSSAWLGGKKNDIIVVMGTPKYPEIAWVKVLSWTDDQLFKVQLESDISDLKVADADTVLAIVSDKTMKGFKRKHFADFKYLKWSIEPPTWLLALLFVVSLIASIGVSIKLANNYERVSN